MNENEQYTTWKGSMAQLPCMVYHRPLQIATLSSTFTTVVNVLKPPPQAGSLVEIVPFY